MLANSLKIIIFSDLKAEDKDRRLLVGTQILIDFQLFLMNTSEIAVFVIQNINECAAFICQIYKFSLDIWYWELGPTGYGSLFWFWFCLWFLFCFWFSVMVLSLFWFCYIAL